MALMLVESLWEILRIRRRSDPGREPRRYEYRGYAVIDGVVADAKMVKVASLF
jgi:hypothetical protein